MSSPRIQASAQNLVRLLDAEEDRMHKSNFRRIEDLRQHQIDNINVLLNLELPYICIYTYIYAYYISGPVILIFDSKVRPLIDFER